MLQHCRAPPAALAALSLDVRLAHTRASRGRAEREGEDRGRQVAAAAMSLFDLIELDDNDTLSWEEFRCVRRAIARLRAIAPSPLLPLPRQPLLHGQRRRRRRQQRHCAASRGRDAVCAGQVRQRGQKRIREGACRPSRPLPRRTRALTAGGAAGVQRQGKPVHTDQPTARHRLPVQGGGRQPRRGAGRILSASHHQHRAARPGSARLGARVSNLVARCACPCRVPRQHRACLTARGGRKSVGTAAVHVRWAPPSAVATALLLAGGGNTLPDTGIPTAGSTGGDGLRLTAGTSAVARATGNTDHVLQEWVAAAATARGGKGDDTVEQGALTTVAGAAAALLAHRDAGVSVERLFARYDVDGSGRIDRGEFRALLQDLGAPAEGERATCRAICRATCRATCSPPFLSRRLASAPSLQRAGRRQDRRHLAAGVQGLAGAQRRVVRAEARRGSGVLGDGTAGEGQN